MRAGERLVARVCLLVTPPQFLAARDGAVRLAQVDRDPYASTAAAGQSVALRPVRGNVLVLDDFLPWPGSEVHELVA